MPRKHAPFGRRSQPWLALTSAAALAAGCAAPTPTGAVVTADQASATMGPVKGGQRFATYVKDGHLFCADCNTELGPDGHHKAANLLINNLKALRTGKVLTMPTAKPGEPTLAQHITIAMLRLGMSDVIKRHLSSTPDTDATLNMLPDYVADYAAAQAYVAANSYGCCVPDGAPTPDGPY